MAIKYFNNILAILLKHSVLCRYIMPLGVMPLNYKSIYRDEHHCYPQLEYLHVIPHE